jgi:hypothetical protein
MYLGLAGCDIDLFASKTDRTVNFCENRVIIAHADIKSRVKFRAALTNNNRSGLGKLPTIELYAAILRVAVSSVPCRTTCFFMSHNPLSVSKTVIYLLFNLIFRTTGSHYSDLRRSRPEKNRKNQPEKNIEIQSSLTTII